MRALLWTVALCALIALAVAQPPPDFGFDGRAHKQACQVADSDPIPADAAFSCPAGTYVYLLNAFWGRRETAPTTACPTPPANLSSLTTNSLCMGAGTTVINAYATQCHTSPPLQSCPGLKPSVSVLGQPTDDEGSPCSSIYKYLELTWHCVPNNCNGRGKFATGGLSANGNAPCICDAGFSGADCEITPCVASGPNQNCFNGQCAPDGTCQCDNGWGGSTCQCDQNSCNFGSGQGQCDSSQINQCICNAGFGGADCGCTRDNCGLALGRGDCKADGTNGECLCDVLFGGADCSCRQSDCSLAATKSGSCKADSTTQECTCEAGYTGADCRCNQASDCSAPLGQGSCTANGTDGACTCNAGFGGITCACSNEYCGSELGPSQGSCNNSEINQCSCESGYGGKNCRCLESDCGVKGDCDSSKEGQNCVCDAGFDGPSCLCSNGDASTITGLTGFVNCGPNGQCSSDWDCSCDAEWFGDYCNCSEIQTCNYQGCNSRTGECVCPDGWGGLNCQCNPVITDVHAKGGNLDAVGTCHQAENAGTCNPVAGADIPLCICNTGDGYNGPNCECLNSRATNGCNGNGLCQAEYFDHRGVVGDTTLCQCDAGFNGVFCQYSDEVTCNGNGTANFDGSCTCNTNWTGTNCEQCTPTFYPKPDLVDLGPGADTTFCINECIDNFNKELVNGADNTGANSCNGHGTCGGQGTCTCDLNSPLNWTNDDTAFAVNGDCDARLQIICENTADPITCPLGTAIDILHATWGAGSDNSIFRGVATAKCGANVQANCNSYSDVDNIKNFTSALCEFGICTDGLVCSYNFSRSALLDLSQNTPSGFLNACYSAAPVYGEVIYTCTPNACPP